MNYIHTKKYLAGLSLLALVFLVLPRITFAETGLIEGSVQYLLWIFVVNVFGMLVTFGAMLLNAGIDYFVIGFGDIFNSSGMGVAVNETWVTIRDFINLFFIFGLVYIGIRMILDSDNSNTRRWLVNLIMAALLVNFSLFATKFVVDFSNKLATEIADAGLGAEKDPTTGVYTSNVGGELMNRMGITSALGGQPKDSGWGYIFGTAILFMVSAFVFAAGGIMLIIRFAVICLYLVLSPVMFASWVLPGLSDTMNRYWKDFIKRCFFAPIYFVFIYFAFQVIGGLQISLKGNGTGANATNLANPNWAGTFNADPAASAQNATLGTLPFFVLICVFMIASLVAANKLGAEGSGKALSLGKKLNNKIQSGVKRGAGAATIGVAASAGRNTVGRLANNYAQSDKGKQRAANSYLGKLRYQASKKIGDSSFDARRVAGLGNELGIGEGQKGGFKTNLDNKAKADRAFAKELGDVDTKTPEGQARVAERTAALKAEAKQKEREAIITQEEFAEDRNQSEQTLTAAIAALTTEIQNKEKALEEDTSKDVLTDAEKKQRAEAIEEQKLRLGAKQSNLDTVKVKDEFLRQRNTYNRTANDSSATEQQKAAARNEFQKSEAAYSKAYADRDKSLKDLQKEAETEGKEANGRAEAEIKYSRQIAYMGQLEQSSQNWGRRTSIGGSAAGAGALAAVVAGVATGGIYTVAAGAGAAAKSAQAANSLKELQKEYGIDGTKKMKKDKRIEQLKDEAAAKKDIEDATEDSKSDDAKK